MAGGGGSFPEWLLDEPGLSAVDGVGFFILMKRATIIMNLRKQSERTVRRCGIRRRALPQRMRLCVGTGHPTSLASEVHTLSLTTPCRAWLGATPPDPDPAR